MTEIIKKVLPFEVKEIAPRVLEFIGSTEDQDRVGDVVMADGWRLDEYKKNPVFLWSHNYNDPPIGKATKVWVEDKKLKFHIKFADKDTYEFADTVYKLYKGGFLRASSVGFMPIKSEPIEVKDEDTMMSQPTRYLEQELLELSGCPVPANPNALAEAKAKGIIKDIQKFIDAQKPYPNEHSCRLRNPNDFQDDSFRRTTRRHDGKEYSVIMGKLKGENTMTEQAYRYGKDIWDKDDARLHCKEHDGTFEPASETREEKYQCECIECGYELETGKHCRDIKCPECGGEMRRKERPGPGKILKSAISYESAHPGGTPKADEDTEWDASREVAKADVEDLKAMCCIVQGDPELKTSYKLPHHLVSGKHAVVWSGVAAAGAVLMGARGGIDASENEKEGAKRHLAKHYEEFGRTPPWKAAEGVNQGMIGDEFDYLLRSIKDKGLSDENKLLAWDLIRQIMRFTGDDIPVDIAEKFGAVLNKVNRERLEKIKDLAQAVLDSAEKPEEPEKSLSKDEIIEIINSSVAVAIDKAKGKLRR